MSKLKLNSNKVLSRKLVKALGATVIFLYIIHSLYTMYTFNLEIFIYGFLILALSLTGIYILRYSVPAVRKNRFTEDKEGKEFTHDGQEYKIKNNNINKYVYYIGSFSLILSGIISILYVNSYLEYNMMFVGISESITFLLIFLLLLLDTFVFSVCMKNLLAYKEYKEG